MSFSGHVIEMLISNISVYRSCITTTFEMAFCDTGGEVLRDQLIKNEGKYCKMFLLVFCRAELLYSNPFDIPDGKLNSF